MAEFPPGKPRRIILNSSNWRTLTNASSRRSENQPAPGVQAQSPFPNRRAFELQYFGTDSVDAGTTEWGVMNYPDGVFYGTHTHDTQGNRTNELAFSAKKQPHAPSLPTTMVWNPDKTKQVPLFGAPAARLAQRHDCISLGQNKYACFYTDDVYNYYREKLRENEEDVQATEAYVRDFFKKAAEAKQEYQLARMGDEERNRIEHSKLSDESVGMSEDDKVRMRQANAQYVLFTVLDEITQTNGILWAYEGVKASALESDEDNPDTDLEDALNDVALTSIPIYAGKPEAFLGVSTLPPGVSDFFCASSGQLSSLMPSLDFYIDGEQVIFPDYTDSNMIKALAKAAADPANILKNRGTIGTDVGIKAFDWEFQNKHEGDRILKASLSLHFGSIRELRNEKWLDFVFTGKNRERDSQPSRFNIRFKDFFDKKFRKKHGMKAADQHRYIEALEQMALSPEWGEDATTEKDAFGTASGRGENANGTWYENRYTPIKDLTVVVGWNVPTGAGAKKLYGSGFLSALKRCKTVIKLNLIHTGVKFGQQGQVGLDLEYIGSLDTFFADADRSDIFRMGDLHDDLYQKDYLVPSAYRAIDGGIAILDPKNYSRPMTLDKFSAADIKKLTGEIPTGPGGEPWARMSNDQKRSARVKAWFQTAKTYYEAAWPKGYIVLQRPSLNGKLTTQSATGHVPAMKVSLKSVEEEVRRLKLLIRAKRLKEGMKGESRRVFNKQHVKWELTGRGTYGELGNIRDNEDIQMHIMYLKAAQSLLHQIQIVSAADRNAAFLNALIAGQRLYYVEVARKALTEGPLSGKQFNYSVNTAPEMVTDDAGSKGKAAELARKTAVQASLADNPEAKKRMKKVFAIDPAPSSEDPNIKLGSEVRVYYMKLGDLLDTIASGLPAEGNATLVLGTLRPASLNFSGFPGEEVISIADIPISLEYFSQWFVDNLKGVAKMSFRSFLNKLFNELVSPLINQVWNKREAASRIYFDFSSMVSNEELYMNNDWYPEFLAPILESEDLYSFNSKSSAGYAFKPKQKNSFFFVQTNLMGNEEELVGDRTQDEANGIVHLVLGSQGSIVKSFDFSEKQLPQIRAMSIENALPLEGLVLPQDCTVTMFGNTFFRNGQHVYINADFGLGRAAQKLGVGGYYTVRKVSNTIESGRFETSLELIRLFGSYR